MERLVDAMARLPVRHQAALRWFIERAGTEQDWPPPLPDGTFLATRAKGIYKPGWSAYALSVRQSLDGPYADRDPVVRPDGAWSYQYYQEGADPARRDDFFTNVGLMACLRDGVPVGVMRQTRGRPGVRYEVLGVARVSGWDDGFFLLEGYSPAGVVRPPGAAAEVAAIRLHAEQEMAARGEFDPTSVIDGRERAIAAIVRRRGQPQFRQALLRAYRGRCAVTGCDAAEALEAAHIVPYRGEATNHPANGILLRADLHALFDLGLIAVDEAIHRLQVAPSLAKTVYGELAGVTVALPDDRALRPNEDALRAHREWSALG